MDIKYTKKKDLVERRSDEVNEWERKANSLREKLPKFKIEYEQAVQKKIRLTKPSRKAPSFSYGDIRHSQKI